MEIKGTAVKSTEKFVRDRFANKYEQWINQLPEPSKQNFEKGIFVAEWYNIQDCVIEPTKLVAEMFFNGDYKKAAFEIGYYSAIEALGGVYKIFVKMASIDFVLKRAATIFSTYYKTGILEVIENQNNERFILSARGFQKSDEPVFDRILGWIKGIFEVLGKSNYLVKYEINDKANNFIDCTFLVIKQ